MSDSRKQTNAVIKDKLQGTVVTYLTCGGIFNNQIKKGLSLHIPVIFFKSVNVWHCYRQKSELCRALSSTFSSVVTKCTQQPPSCL